MRKKLGLFKIRFPFTRQLPVVISVNKFGTTVTDIGYGRAYLQNVNGNLQLVTWRFMKVLAIDS